MELSQEEIIELIDMLNVAFYDASEIVRLSHDTEEIKAYKEHRKCVVRWIRRLEDAIGVKEQIDVFNVYEAGFEQPG